MTPPTTTRGAQPTSTGLGHHFVSPTKSRDKRKTQITVQIPGIDSKHDRILAKIAELMKPQVQGADSSGPPSTSPPQLNATTDLDVNDSAMVYDYDNVVTCSTI
jgi:hypothetical protein